MEKDEIKRMYSMKDILARYNLFPNRAGFVKCPFHKGDRTASMKVYNDNFHCFGCGADGDIFKFVMLMDGVSFKDAFLSLGGEYDHAETQNERRHRRRDLLLAERERQKKEKVLQDKKNEMRDLGAYLSLLVMAEKSLEPLSDAWCLVENELPQTYGRWLELREEVNEK